MKTVLITGASSGIGAEYAKILSKDYKLILISRNKKELEKVKSNCLNKNNIIVIDKDLTKINSIENLFKELKKKNITIDILINNAGLGDYNKFEKSSLEKQNMMIELNIKALTTMTYYFLQQRNKKVESYILNMGSVASFFPGPNMGVYFATKAYVLSFSEALMEELKNTNVNISVFCPGPTKSNFGNNANINYSENIPTAKEIAEIGIKGLFNHKQIIIPGIKNKILIFLSKLLPRKIIRNMIAKITHKVSK